MSNSKLIQQQIDALQKKYGKGNLFIIEVDGKELVFKKPDRNTISAFQKAHTIDPIEANLSFAKNCLVEGDENVFEDIDILMSLIPHFESFVKIHKVEIKNF